MDPSSETIDLSPETIDLSIKSPDPSRNGKTYAARRDAGADLGAAS